MPKFWDKVKSWIFEEVDEDEEEGAQPAAAHVEQPSPARSQPVVSPAASVKKEAGRAKTPDLVTLEPKKPAKPKTAPPASKPAGQDRAEARPKAEYAFADIISPIYGKKDSGEEKEAEKPPVYPRTTSEKSPLGTVLSPMYGPLDPSRREAVPREVAEMTIDDLLESDVQPEEPAAQKPQEKKLEETENLSLFDDEEQ